MAECNFLGHQVALVGLVLQFITNPKKIKSSHQNACFVVTHHVVHILLLFVTTD